MGIVNPDLLLKKRDANNARANEIARQMRILDNSRANLLDELKGLAAKNEQLDELIKEFEAPVQVEPLGPDEHPEGAVPPENTGGDEQK